MKTTAPLDRSFFTHNREKLRQSFTGKAPIVITGNGLIQKSADSAYPFRQDSSFWYLTGIELPGYLLVMDVDSEYLIAPKEDEVRDIFEGKTDLDLVKEISGIEEIATFAEGWKKLDRKIKKSKHVASMLPPAEVVESMSMYTSPARRLLSERIKNTNPDIDFIDLRSVLASLRSVKSSEEISQIEWAVSETKELYKLLEKWRVKYDNERDIFAELSRETVRRNIEFAYDPIIAGGGNALVLHYTKNESPINRRKFLLIDMAARAGYYNADITRTVVETPTKRQSAVYHAVLDIQSQAISLLKPGISLRRYEEELQLFIGEKLRELGLIKSINKESVREYCPHSTSHFLGIDVHDVGNPEETLQEGMVLTVEPGIYIKSEGIGIRIEDMVRISSAGCEVLSLSIPKYIDKFF